jgi:hypothetical protein
VVPNTTQAWGVPLLTPLLPRLPQTGNGQFSMAIEEQAVAILIAAAGVFTIL